MTRKPFAFEDPVQVDTLRVLRVHSGLTHDSRGNAGILIGVILTFIFSLLFVLHAETEMLNNKVMRVQNALDSSISAAFTRTDLRTQGIPASLARETFGFYLRENLLLDGSMVPLPGSIASERVTYEIMVYNTLLVYNTLPNKRSYDGKVGDLTPTGTLVEEPGIWARVEVPVRPLFVGILGDRLIIRRDRLVELFFMR